MKPLVKNASDESQIQSARIKQKLGEESEANDLRFILSTEQGRRFIWKLISKCGVFRQSFTGNSQTFFMEGERNIGLFILDSVMRADPESYLKMYVQAKKEGNE